MKKLLSFFGIFLTLGLPSVADAASAPVSALAEDGTVYSVRGGTYGELFPQGKAAGKGIPVLALDVKAPDAPAVRSLVSGTDDPAVESDVSLIFEDSSNSLFVVWQKTAKQGDSTLVLAGLQEGAWSPPIEILGSIGCLPATSSLAVTRDSYDTGGAEDPALAVVHRRTVVHLAWMAGPDSSSAQPFYTPVLFQDGVFVGWNPVVSLRELLGELTAAVGGTVRAPTLNIQPGVDNRSVVIGFSDALDGRLATVESRLLPMELAALARAAAIQTREELADRSPEETVENVAGGVGSTMIDIGYRFHVSLKEHFATKAKEAVLSLAEAGGAGSSSEIEAVAGGVGSVLIDVGLRVFGNDGMQRDFLADRLFVLSFSEAGAVELDRLFEAETVPHLLRLYVVADRPAPETGEQAPSLLLSENGEHSLVTWEEPGTGKVRYRESTGEAWSEVQSLTLSKDLSRDQALEILRQRVQKR